MTQNKRWLHWVTGIHLFHFRNLLALPVDPIQSCFKKKKCLVYIYIEKYLHNQENARFYCCEPADICQAWPCLWIHCNCQCTIGDWHTCMSKDSFSNWLSLCERMRLRRPLVKWHSYICAASVSVSFAFLPHGLSLWQIYLYLHSPGLLPELLNPP